MKLQEHKEKGKGKAQEQANRIAEEISREETGEASTRPAIAGVPQNRENSLQWQEPPVFVQVCHIATPSLSSTNSHSSREKKRGGGGESTIFLYHESLSSNST